MFYVIQTNTHVNNGQSGDFQNWMYKITKQTWDEFKDYIISDEKFTDKITKGTMTGYTKPRDCVIEEVLINDDFHLEVIIQYGMNKVSSRYYMVTEENFKGLL